MYGCAARRRSSYERMSDLQVVMREVQLIIETWRQHDNEVRLHSSLQYMTPAEFK